MNNQRRKAIGKLEGKLLQIKEALDGIYDEERDALDGQPEGIQKSDRWIHQDEKAEELAEIVIDIDDLIERLQEAVESF